MRVNVIDSLPEVQAEICIIIIEFSSYILIRKCKIGALLCRANLERVHKWHESYGAGMRAGQGSPHSPSAFSVVYCL